MITYLGNNIKESENQMFLEHKSIDRIWAYKLHDISEIKLNRLQFLVCNVYSIHHGFRDKILRPNPESAER